MTNETPDPVAKAAEIAERLAPIGMLSGDCERQDRYDLAYNAALEALSSRPQGVSEDCPYCTAPVIDSPLQKLGAHLANLLDEDQWAAAEQYLNAALRAQPSPSNDAGGVEQVDREAIGEVHEYLTCLATFARVDARVMRKRAMDEHGTPFAVEYHRKAETADAEEKRHTKMADKLAASLRASKEPRA